MTFSSCTMIPAGNLGPITFPKNVIQSRLNDKEYFPLCYSILIGEYW